MIKHRIYSVIKDQPDSTAGRLFTASMSLLIICNVVFVLIDTVSHEPGGLARAANVIEIASVSIFTVEYVLRLWTADLVHPDLPPAKARLRYVVSVMAIIDLLSILPFYLRAFFPFDLRVLRILRLVRLMRVFKLGRYSSALATIGRVMKRSAAALLSALSVVGLLLIVSSVLMYYAESGVQPKEFSSAFSGLWWAVTTITTVGYGDIFPVTVMGRIFAAVIELLGIALVAIPTGIISAGFMSELSNGPVASSEASARIDRLEALRGLLDSGHLNRDEFDVIKHDLLSADTSDG